MGAAPKWDHPQCQQDMLLCAHVGFSSALCKGPGGAGLTHFLSKISTGFPRAPASGCPSEVVREHTRDKLGKDKGGDSPAPLFICKFKCYFYLCGGV